MASRRQCKVPRLGCTAQQPFPSKPSCWLLIVSCIARTVEERLLAGRYMITNPAPPASSRFGNRCSPAYMDCAETWKPYTLGSTTLMYFDELTHSKLCTELLLEEVCRDLSAVMQSTCEGERRCLFEQRVESVGEWFLYR